MSFISKVAAKFESIYGNPRLSWWRTIYINFRTLPFKDAILLPLRIYGKIRLACLQGDILLPDKNTKIYIGRNDTGYRNTCPGRISILNNAKLILHQGVRIFQGANIIVNTGAELELKSYSTVGDSTDIICYKHIVLGHRTGLTWQCQCMDFNSHFIRCTTDEEGGGISTIFKPVIIGDYCWIGNRTTVMPGTKLPDRTIVASNSLLNKDYTKTIEPNTMIAGQPGKPIKSGVARIYDTKLERELMDYFRNSEECSIGLNNIITD